MPGSHRTHVTDLVSTIYEIAGIKAPEIVEGYKQDPIDGVSFACS